MSVQASVSQQAVSSALASLRPDSSKRSPSDNVSYFPLGLGGQSMLQLKVRLSDDGHTPVQRSPPEMVFVVDISGSMFGEPIRQVNAILRKIADVCTARQLPMPRVIQYDTSAQERSLPDYLKAPPDPYAGTHFSVAFDAMITYLTKYQERRLTALANGQTTVGGGVTFMFLSDGDANAADQTRMKTSAATLRSVIHGLDSAFAGAPVQVHVIGLGSDVKQKLLTEVSQLGNCEGSFRWSAQAEGLGDKFIELFEFGQTEVPCTVHIEASEAEDHGLNLGSCLTIERLPSHARIVEEEVEQQSTSKRSRREETMALLTARALSGGTKEPGEVSDSLCFSEHEEGAKAKNTPQRFYLVECLVKSAALASGSTVTVTLAGMSSSHVFDLGEPVMSPSPLSMIHGLEMYDITKVEDVLDVMKVLASVKTRGRGISERFMLDQAKSTLQTRLTSCLELLNAQAQSSAHGAEVSALRLKDLRHEYKFSKSRRARIMAVREADNIKAMKTLEAKLTKAKDTWTSTEIEAMEALAESDDWSCLLSLESATDLLKGSVDDFLCVGLLVERDECVIDSPSTGLVVKSIATSLVSFNSFIDAMTSAVAEKGFERSVGAFHTKKRGQMGDVNGADRFARVDAVDVDANGSAEPAYCIVGQGREKINAVFPLHLCSAHMKRVSLLRRVWLSYFFTLDSFGYDKQQEIACLATLGAMITVSTGTEREARILREVAKVCATLLTYSSAVPSAFPPQRYHNFVHTIEGRAKQYTPNLIVPLVMAWLGDEFRAVLCKKPKLTPTSASDPKPAATTSSLNAVSLDAELDSAELTLSLDLLTAIYFAYTQRLVRDGYAALQVESHKIVARLLYGEDYATKSKNASSSSSSGVPFHIRQEQAIAEFAAWFYDPSQAVPSLPTTNLNADVSANCDRRVEYAIALTPDVGELVNELLPRLPSFLVTLATKLDQLRAKWKEIDHTDATTDRASALGSTTTLLDLLHRVLPSSDRSDLDRVEMFRRHLLAFYWYHNDSPPVSCTLDSIVVTCHARLTTRANEKLAAAAQAENQDALAALISGVDDLAAFAGLLRFYCPSRNGALFRLVVARLLHRADREKLLALLTNEVNGLLLYDTPSLAGWVWIPTGLGLMSQIRGIIGNPIVSSIAAKHRQAGLTSGHLYRASDLPNSHGHCNSNPWPHHAQKFVDYA